MNHKRYGLMFNISWVLLLLCHSISSAAQPLTTRVSVDSSGNESGSLTLSSSTPSISADGRFVAFDSDSTNLDTVATTVITRDIFVHDRQTAQTTMVSVNSSGTAGNEQSDSASISADGRFVAFYSIASNLVPGDANNIADIFVRNRQTGKTSRVNVDSNGIESEINKESYYPSISADGRFVAFSSDAGNLVPNDTNGSEDVFVRGPLFTFPWAMFLPAIIGTKP